jgi:hypothetical protein
MPNHRTVLSLFLALFFHLSPIQVFSEQITDEGHLLPVGGKLQRVHGINLAWYNGAYGHDFGLSPLHPQWGIAFSEQGLDECFVDMQQMNLNVCRIWVFEDLEGLQFDSSGYVKGIHPSLIANFNTAAKLAEKRDLHLYLALSAGFRKSIREGGFRDIIADPVARRCYLENAVMPFVENFKNNPTVFAIDVMNEPEGEIKGPQGNRSEDGYSGDIMREFIKSSVAAVKQADTSRLVSCGSGWHGPENIKAGFYRSLGLDFYDFHQYNNEGSLPAISSLNVDRPVLVGECNQDNDLPVIDDALQTKAIRGFLENAKREKYAGVVVWYYDHRNNKSDQRFLSLFQGGGSRKLRPAAEVIRDFK